jgi:hypothetical protein
VRLIIKLPLGESTVVNYSLLHYHRLLRLVPKCAGLDQRESCVEMSVHRDETFAWITGNNPTISYRHVIATGSWGVVHEVSKLKKVVIDLYENVAGKVCILPTHIGF